ncbi:MAG: HEAT repeat domain-containing protein [Planctomycetota bacterium]|jgi:hypothetical protein
MPELPSLPVGTLSFSRAAVLSAIAFFSVMPAGAAVVEPKAQHFERLLESSLAGKAYVRERDTFLSRDGVPDFLRVIASRPSNAAGKVLAKALIARLESAKAFNDVHEQLGRFVKWRMEPRRPTRRKRPPIAMDSTIMVVMDRQAAMARYTDISPESVELAPGVTWDEALESTRRAADARFWSADMPALGPCMLEIALKGWPDEAITSELRRLRIGDLHRYMAVHVLGELRFAEATDWLVDILGRDSEDPYLRAHAARALSKIADAKSLPALARVAFLTKTETIVRKEIRFGSGRELRFNPRVPDYVLGSFRFRPFDAVDVTRALSKLLLESEDRDVKMALVSALQSQGNRSRDAGALAREALRVMAKDDDIQVRLAARRGLERLSGAAGSRASRVKDTWLEYDSCLPATEWRLLREAAEGDADPARLAAGRRRSVAIIDKVAGGYTHANAFATADLQIDGWPSKVGNAAARDFFEAARGLKKGMPKAEVLDVLGAELMVRPHDTDYSLGGEVEYLRARRRFDEKVEGLFGLKRAFVEFALVFVEDELWIVHAPQR